MSKRYTFDFAISFAGEDRRYAEQIANKLTRGGASVFYDYYFKSHLLGKRLRQEFANIYGSSTCFFVPLISNHYVKKDFTNYEWEIAKEEQTKRSVEFVLPIRLDDSKLIGLHGDVQFCDLRKESVESIVQDLLQKLIPSEEVNTDWVATVGINVDDAVENWREIPRFRQKNYQRIPISYAEICDWFEKDLRKRLAKFGLKDWGIVEDSRHGDTLSIRFRFHWAPPDNPLDFGPLAWWEVLEVAPFKEIYPEQ